MVRVGLATIPSLDASACAAKDVTKQVKAGVEGKIKAALNDPRRLSGQGRPQADEPARRVRGDAGLRVWPPRRCSGPIAACLVELFPTRIRYTALSLPYNIGTGWIGGFVPFTAFAIVAAVGNIYAGLWYPFAFTAISVVVTHCSCCPRPGTARCTISDARARLYFGPA